MPNAGVARSTPIAELSLADWRRVQEVNSTGVFLTVREAARLMKLQGTGGNIVIQNGTTPSGVNDLVTGASTVGSNGILFTAGDLATDQLLEAAVDDVRIVVQ